MKKTLTVIFASFLMVSTINCQTSQNDFPVLKGPYLGQKPPGTVPEIFAPGIISRPEYFEHSAAIFTPDGKEVYWSALPNGKKYCKIYFMKMVDGIWSKPVVAEFCMENIGYALFTLSPNGKKLYFGNEDENKLGFVEKQNGVWSKPKAVSSKIDSEAPEYICSITNNGSVYFIRYSGFDAFVSRAVNGVYEAPEKLANQINSSDTKEFSVYVAPDESYMVIEASKDEATCELFVSFRMKDNTWSERIKLPIKWGRFPSVSPDGKYLFFMTRDAIYWVSAKIIEELMPKELIK